MPELSFALRVIVPDLVDAATMREIDGDAQPHDRPQAAAIARWLGGELEDVADTLASRLPDEWGVSVGGAFFASPSLEVNRNVYRERRAGRAGGLDPRRDDDDRRAADGDEQRDYAEERFNRDLQREQ